MSEAYIRAAVLSHRVREFARETGKYPTPDQGRRITTEVYQMLAAEKRKWQAEAWWEGFEQGFTHEESTPSGIFNDPPLNPYEQQEEV